MKVKVIKRFCINGTSFKVDDVLNVIDGAVCYEDYWVCDVSSPTFTNYFRIVEQ